MWDKYSTASIATISETFGIPASTLRYWESMGLISLERRDNNYREYDYASLLDICDIVYMRKLGISVKAIKMNHGLTLAESNELYIKKKDELEAQIGSLQNTYSMLSKTLSLMSELEEIYRHPYAEAQPDIPLLLKHSQLYDRSVWEKYFSGQYQFAGVRLSPPENRWIWGWAADAYGQNEELAWTFDGQNRRFVQFILRISIKDRKHTNIGEAVDYLTDKGYSIGEIIVRYVTVAQEKGERWDYYKAWIELL